MDSCNYCQECVLEKPPAADTATAERMRLSHLRHLSHLLSNTFSGRHSAVAVHTGGAATDDGILDAVWANEADAAYDAAAAASGIPGVLTNPHLVQPGLIRPLDHDEKQLKPNCSRCTGCTTVLTDMHAAPMEADGLEGVPFMHGKGATNGWLFFGHVSGSSKRFIVKVGKTISNRS